VISVLAGLLAATSVASLLASVALRSDPAVESLAGIRSRGARRGLAGQVVAAAARRPLVRRIARVDRLDALVRAAGWSRSATDLMAVKAVLAMGVALTMTMSAPALLPIGIVAAAGAFVAPDVVVARAARARVREADAEVPQFLDLLAAASSAGLGGPAAIRRAASGLRGPLGDELTAAAAAVGVGARWREEVRSIAERLELPDLSAAVRVLIRTETLGSSLAENLRGLSVDVRDARRARATERARTAPVKMLFPLVFMVLPAFLLLSVVPVLIATVRSLG
jgi:tight adherence protein C